MNTNSKRSWRGLYFQELDDINTHGSIMKLHCYAKQGISNHLSPSFSSWSVPLGGHLFYLTSSDTWMIATWTAKEGIASHFHFYQPKPIYIVSIFEAPHLSPIYLQSDVGIDIPILSSTKQLPGFPPFQASTSASMKSLRVKALDESLWSCCSPMVPRNHATTMQQPWWTPHGSSKGARK